MSAKPVALSLPPEIVDLSALQNRSPRTTALFIFASDLITLSLVFAVAVIFRHLANNKYDLTSYFWLSSYIALMLGVFWIQGLYPCVLVHPAEEMRRVFYSVSFVFLFMAATTFLFRSAESYSRAVFLITWVCGAPLVLLSRVWVRHRLSRYSWWGVPTLVLGSGLAAKRVARALQSGKLGIRVTGILSEEPPHVWENDLPRYLGHPSAAPSLALSRFVQYVIIAMPEKLNTELLKTIRDYCHGFAHILLVPDMPGLCSLGMLARDFGGEIGFELPQRLFHRNSQLAKRAVDILASGLAIIALLPLFLLIALLVRLASPGPIFYGQERLGKHGRTFKALKFRTMVPNADALLAAYLVSHPEIRFEWERDHKLKNDPRVTKVGKWLRVLSLDELPQLLNVFLGDMSLVGPRPIVQAEIRRYGDGYDLYKRVRPGITGLWQVSGRNNTTYDERVTFDEYYVHNWSIWLDLYVLARTVKVVLTADGAY